MPVLGDAKTFKRLGYKKVRSKGKNTYTKDVRVKKIKLDEMQSDVQKKASGGSAELIKDIKPPSQGSGKAKIKKPIKPLNKEKRKAKVDYLTLILILEKLKSLQKTKKQVQL